MKYFINAESGAFLLRITLASVLLAHSLYLKMVVYSLAGTAAFFASTGLPEMLAYVVFCIEAVSGFALLLGFNTLYFSLLVIPIFLGATWVHSANGWLFTNTGGGWEYPLLLSVMAIIQMSLGDGKYSISAYLKSKQPVNL